MLKAEALDLKRSVSEESPKEVESYFSGSDVE
jgi:hypothetical protein